VPIGLLIIGLQIFFAVHAVKTGKDSIWLWLIILAPGIGCAIYFFTQYGPEAANSRAAGKVKKGLMHTVDPQRELRRCKDMLEMSNSVTNKVALADQYILENMYDEAIDLLNNSLVGPHKSDAGIMERLARAQFAKGYADKTVATLDALKAANPDYKSTDSHLLYARALEAQNKNAAAIVEYEVLRISYPGEEARVRYGQLLQRIGKTTEASVLFQESLDRAKRAPKHYKAKEKEWLNIAEHGSNR